MSDAGIYGILNTFKKFASGAVDTTELLHAIEELKSMQTAYFPQPMGATLWNDYLTPIASGKVPAQTAPTWGDVFAGDSSIRAYSFAVGDFIYMHPIHILHDIKVGSQVHPHVHWMSDGTDTNPVKWELTYSIAKGHQQEAFPTPSTLTITGTPTGTAYTHMVSEVTPDQALDAPEPDSLVMMSLKRVANGATDNTDTIFGLNLDFHVEIERLGTPEKAPNFYGE